MKSNKAFADEFLRRKARGDIKADEAEKTNESLKAMVKKQLTEIEAEKPPESDFKEHTTKPMPGLEIHTVEPVIPIEEKVIEEPVKKVVKEPVKKVVKEPVKKVVKEPVKKVVKEPVERRRLNLMPPFSPFERRGSRIL